MANFKVKNGLQAGRYLLNSTTLSGPTIDLSLANMFSTTLSSDPAYAFTNPPPSGTAQAFSVEVTGGTTTFTQDSFATTLYTGNSSIQTITNGLDLAADGGLIWTKVRDQSGGDHSLIDSASSWTEDLVSNKTDAAATTSYLNFSASSTGYSINTAAFRYNENNANYVSWTFKKQAKFFDIITYTGDGVAGRTVSHNLGADVGTLIVKKTNSADNWFVWHRGLTDATYRIMLNSTSAETQQTNAWNSTAPTSTEFTLGDNGNTNASGDTYVAYLFAHDTASDSRIKCGSYTGNGATTGVFQDLGWQPQWIMIKNTDLSTEQWHIFDNVRGVVTDGADQRLEASRNVAEAAADSVDFTTTGFYPKTVDDKTNGSGHSYIYMAIRGDAATDSAITWPSSVKWPSGLAPTTPAPGKKDLFTFLTTDGGTTYYGKKAAEGIA